MTTFSKYAAIAICFLGLILLYMVITQRDINQIELVEPINVEVGVDTVPTS